MIAFRIAQKSARKEVRVLITATEIRKGMVIKVDDEPYLVLDREHVAPGNWRAMVQAKLRSIRQGNTIQRRFRSSDKFETVFLESKVMEYLYKQGDSYTFMDTESFEQVPLSADLVGDFMPYVALNSQVRVAFYDGRPLSVDLPASVVLKVAETDPGAKGNSVTNVFKPAKLETGLVVKVPLFINVGDKVKVDTRSGEFIQRE
jgi:elongation factor P